MPALSTHSNACPAFDAVIPPGNSVASQTFPVNNTGMFYPILVEKTVTVYQMSLVVTVQSGSVDVGIYDEFGAAIVRAGAVSVAAAGLQTFDITDTTLTPNIYWFAIGCTTTVAAFRGASGSGILTRAMGAFQVASAYSSGLITPVTYAFPAASTAFFPMLTAHLVSTV